MVKLKCKALILKQLASEITYKMAQPSRIYLIYLVLTLLKIAIHKYVKFQEWWIRGEYDERVMT